MGSGVRPKAVGGEEGAGSDQSSIGEGGWTRSGGGRGGRMDWAKHRALGGVRLDEEHWRRRGGAGPDVGLHPCCVPPPHSFLLGNLLVFSEIWD